MQSLHQKERYLGVDNLLDCRWGLNLSTYNSKKEVVWHNYSSYSSSLSPKLPYYGRPGTGEGCTNRLNFSEFLTPNILNHSLQTLCWRGGSKASELVHRCQIDVKSCTAQQVYRKMNMLEDWVSLHKLLKEYILGDDFMEEKNCHIPL